MAEKRMRRRHGEEGFDLLWWWGVFVYGALAHLRIRCGSRELRGIRISTRGVIVRWGNCIWLVVSGRAVNCWPCSGNQRNGRDSHLGINGVKAMGDAIGYERAQFSIVAFGKDCLFLCGEGFLFFFSFFLVVSSKRCPERLT